ncbi:MAG: beta-lactamase family protein, partial [Oscillospiraceae bacterium]|nr:beta-lactamase family protein [Oscillospiraceae bacterium]
MNFDKLTAYLDSIYAEKNIPGVGMTVAIDNNPVYEHYYGWSNVKEKVPFSPKTMFNLYSATKLVTCTCALQLIEQGKIHLTDPLYEYIPEYKHPNVKVKTDGDEVIREAGTVITLEHLFTMTSGISGRRDAPAILKVVEDTQGRAPTVDIVRAAAEEPLNFEPGSHFQYGYSHDVLGAVVEIVSGQRLGAYMKEHVFDPLGMGSTAFDLPEGKERYRTVLYNGFDAATGKAESIGQAFKLQFGSEYEMGGGGLLSCVPDYSRFARALANGGVGGEGERILNPETIGDWRTNRLSGVPLEDFAVFGGWSKAGYGYGLGVRTLMDRERNNSLSEAGEFGWDGAQGCYVVVDPKARVAIFYAQQEGGSQWWT